MNPFTPWPERIVRQNSCMNTRPCAVLVPVISSGGEEYIVFEVRSPKLSWQPGDICFPGGAVEPGDPSPLAAALRETKEELFLDESRIHVWGPLDYVESPIGVLIHPFAACIDADPQELSFSRDEVDRLLTVPLSWFDSQEPEISAMEIATRPAPAGEGEGALPWQKRGTYHVRTYRYVSGGETYKIWGITAQILDNFRDIRAIMEQ